MIFLWYKNVEKGKGVGGISSGQYFDPTSRYQYNYES